MVWLATLLIAPPLKVQVPKRPAAKIDGVISEGEWISAREIAKQGNNRVLAMHDGEALYLALMGERNAIGSIQMQDGQTVRILHASAALGEATYVPAADKWNPGKGFAWACRKMDDSPASLKEQADFYKANGWLANTVQAGKVREYKIRKDLLRSPLAVALYGYEPEGVLVALPATSDDDAYHGKLIGGWQPAGLKFKSDGWSRIMLEGA